MSRARADEEMAEMLLEGGAASWGVCYHAQQAVEKALKALFVANGVDPDRTHSLVRLNADLQPPLLGPEEDDSLAALTLWSVEQRYPADNPDPTTAQARRAVEFGRRVIDEAKRRLIGFQDG
jgi:HEPN domain-containing protein